MTTPEGADDRDAALRARVRREPPRFRRLTVARTAPLSPWMIRVTLTGPELDGFGLDAPAASVRLLVPADGEHDLVLPSWNGNEFLRADGSRPVIRTFTPRRVDPTTLEIDLDVVLHGEGPASEWAAGARPGDRVALSGPGRGYAVAADAPAFLLAGDESALPAMSQLLEVLPQATPVQVFVEVTHADARQPLPPHPSATAVWLERPEPAPWGDAMVEAVRGAEVVAGTRVWVAGEAAAVQRIRRHLFEERSWPRTHTVVRGYWKTGRGGDVDDD